MRPNVSRTRGPRGYARGVLVTGLAVGTAALLAACRSSTNSASSSNASASAPTGNAKKCSTLNLYTWEGEAPTTLTKPFEEKYGVPVKATYMTSAAEVLAKLVAGGGKHEDHA